MYVLSGTVPTFGTKLHLTTRYGPGVSPHHCLIDDHRHHNNHLIRGAHQRCLLGNRAPSLCAVTWLTAATKQRSSSVVHSCGLDIIGCRGCLDKDVQRISFPCLHYCKRRGSRRNVRS